MSDLASRCLCGVNRHAILSAFALAVLSTNSIHCAAESRFPEGIHERLVTTVGTAETEAYRAIVEEFDVYLKANSDDSIALVERCRFISNFAYREDETIASAYEDSEACIEELADGKQSLRPEVKLFLLEQKWGDEAVHEAERLLASAKSWPASRRAALHARLSQLYELSDPNKAGRHATAAVELDPGTDVQIAAATYQLRIGAKRKAVELISTLPQDGWNAWNLEQAVDLLLKAGDVGTAYQLVEAKPEIQLGETARYGLARALLEAGDSVAGKSIMRHPATESEGEEYQAFRGYAPLRQFFELQRDYSSPAEALTAYQELRDIGWRADPFAWYRLSLATVAPAAPWRLRDLLGIAAFVSALVAIAMLPLVVIVPIHYRSLAKRVRGAASAESSPVSTWTLADMWYATGAILTLMTLALYVTAYPYFENLLTPVFDEYVEEQATIDHASLGRAYLLFNVLCLVAMIPLLRKVPWRSLTASQWSLRRSLTVGAGAGLAFVILATIVNGLLAWNGLAIGPGSETFMAMQGINEAFGALALIAFACILTPLLEEFVFRGVVLRASAQHLALWVAVLVQASLFVFWHEDAGDYPALFLFALASAWLALRSGGLAAPIAFHAMVNLIAVAGILQFSRAINPAG
jgi:membrane protease YdiL (CAAX protease family)